MRLRSACRVLATRIRSGAPRVPLAGPAALPAAALAILAGPAAADHLARVVLELEGLGEPVAAALAADGRAFVLDREGARVLVLDESGALVGELGGSAGMRAPEGLALDPSGGVWVADTGRDRVVRLGPDGALAAQVGRRGTGPGELLGPRGVAVVDETLVVADTGNARVQLFAVDGAHRAVLGHRGTGDGELLWPVAVAVDRRGHLHAVDAARHRVVRLDREGRVLGGFGGFGERPGLLSHPADVAYADGVLYVADRGNARLVASDVNGRVLYEARRSSAGPGDARGHEPFGLAVARDRSRAVLCEPRLRRVRFLDDDDEGDAEAHAHAAGSSPQYGGGAHQADGLLALVDDGVSGVRVADASRPHPVPIATIGGDGARLGRLVAPADAAVAGTRVWTSEPALGRLQLFEVDPDEPDPRTRVRFVKALDVHAVRDHAAFAPLDAPPTPGALAVADDGSLFAADAQNGTVLAFTPALAPRGRIGRRGDGPGELLDPVDLAWRDGRLYVLDRARAAVSVFAPDGALVRDLVLPGGGAPRALAVGPDRLWVADARAAAVRAFDREGSELSPIGGGVTGALALRDPAGLALTPAGHLVVVDRGHRRGLVVTAEGRFLVSFGDHDR